MYILNDLIRLTHLKKTYNIGECTIFALNDITFHVKSGEFISIVGQSGSGKSTLMNIIGCLDVPTSGEYFLNNELTSNMTGNQLSTIRNTNIGFIFQGFNLIPNLNALENVELPLIYRGMNKKDRYKKAYESLIKVGLKNRIHHYPAQMSGGQQQRVAIARAIAGNPPIILADEPTGNLDSASGKDILNLLKELNYMGKTVILITHDNKIAQAATRTIKISDGKIISDKLNFEILSMHHLN